MCELWVPDPSKAFLQCKAACYVGYEGFGRQSHGVAFARGEGLPGRVWATRRPELLATLDAPSDFVRARAAADADLSAGLGLPIIRNDQVIAVMTFLYSQGPEPSGVMEVWGPSSDGRELTWRSGFYGQLDEIREVSVTTTFAPGQGLPGRVWQSRLPELVESLWEHSDGEFVREEVAMVAGLTMGFAIPVIHGGEVQSVAALLSTVDMPFAKVLEIWLPNEDGTALHKKSGYYGRYAKFTDDAQTTFGLGEGVPGQVWQTGEPQLISPLTEGSGFARYQAAQSVDLSVAIGIPVIDGNRVTAVILILN
ncbi:MAG: GAF domain-containing protein [Myxococcales bacterium]|nr:GAF domain-containing protein [Myxococcales bacterium]